MNWEELYALKCKDSSHMNCRGVLTVVQPKKTYLISISQKIYTAMVAERDIYLAKGLDELGRNLSNELCRQTVAVVGMAHVDGIETYLASARWKEVV